MKVVGFAQHPTHLKHDAAPLPNFQKHKSSSNLPFPVLRPPIVRSNTDFSTRPLRQLRNYSAEHLPGTQCSTAAASYLIVQMRAAPQQTLLKLESRRNCCSNAEMSMIPSCTRNCTPEKRDVCSASSFERAWWTSRNRSEKSARFKTSTRPEGCH